MFFKSEEASGQAADLSVTPPSPPRSRPRPDNRSVITDDIRITGDLSGSGDLRIDGAVEGNIRCRGLIIGESGRVEGEITAETVEIGGRFNGKITTRVLTLTRSARVDGTLSVSESLAVEAGAHFEGYCERPPVGEGSAIKGAGKGKHMGETEGGPSADRVEPRLAQSGKIALAV